MLLRWSLLSRWHNRDISSIHNMSQHVNLCLFTLRTWKELRNYADCHFYRESHRALFKPKCVCIKLRDHLQVATDDSYQYRWPNCHFSRRRLCPHMLPSVLVACLSQPFRSGCVCWRGGELVSKHRRAAGSGIAPSMTERGFFSFSVLRDPLHDAVNTCVWCLSKLRGITNTGSDRARRTFQSSRGQGRCPH